MGLCLFKNSYYVIMEFLLIKSNIYFKWNRILISPLYTNYVSPKKYENYKRKLKTLDIFIIDLKLKFFFNENLANEVSDVADNLLWKLLFVR